MQNLTLRQLRSLIAIHHTGKIASAAGQLGLTGPAVTLQLKQMEEELGTELFDRTQEGMKLTQTGQSVFEAANRITSQLRRLDEELTAIKSGQFGSLRLNVVSTAKYFAPRLIAEFKRTHPEIRIDLAIGNREQTLESLSSHSTDIALMGRPPRNIPVRSMVFGDHPLVIIAPPDHKLAKARDITKEAIAAENFIIRESGSGTRMALEMFFADVPTKLDDLGMAMDSNETIKQAVMAGLGIAFISAHTIETELELKRLVILDVQGMPIRRQWFAVSHSRRSISPVMEAFENFLFKQGPRFLPVIAKTYPATQWQDYSP